MTPPTETLPTQIATVDVLCHFDPICTVGRPPRDTQRRRTRNWFADMAGEEAASVAAFRRLRCSLRHLGAPAPLRARVGEAARDEVRHARLLTARSGGARTRLRLPPDGRPTWLDLARDNAVLGVVGETWAALVAHVVALRAVSDDDRRLFSSIAADETRHAVLAHDLAAFFDEHLSARDRRHVSSAVRTARRRLVRKLRHGRAPSGLGLPEKREAAGLAASLFRARLGVAIQRTPMA